MTRNFIKVVMALQILVKGAMLALVAAGQRPSGKVLGRSHGSDSDCRRYDRGGDRAGSGCSSAARNSAPSTIKALTPPCGGNWMAATLLLFNDCLPWLGALLVWWAGDARPASNTDWRYVFGSCRGGCAIIARLTSTEPAYWSTFRWAAHLAISPSRRRAGRLSGGGRRGGRQLAVIFSVDYMRGERQLGRYYALVLFFIGAMVGLVLTTNLLLIFVFLGDHRAVFLRVDFLLQR